MRHFNSVNLIHLLLQLKAKPALGDSKQDRLRQLNHHADCCMTKLLGKPDRIFRP